MILFTAILPTLYFLLPLPARTSKTGMTMTEGMHAIAATGILRRDGADDTCYLSLENEQSCSRRAIAGGDSPGACAPAQALEYFNSHAGAWYAIRNASDW